MTYLVALETGGLMEAPDIGYQDFDFVDAKNEHDAKSLYNKKHNCSFYYGDVIGTFDDAKVNHKICYNKGVKRLLNRYDIDEIKGLMKKYRKKNNVTDNTQKTSNWRYETGFEEPEILGSGSNRHNLSFFNNEEKAINDFINGRKDYLIRFRIENGRRVNRYYDIDRQGWMD